jgi:hypothetical protein
VRDKRLVRIDFGPLSERIVITGFGVYEFVLSSREPWGEYPGLKKLFRVEDGHSLMLQITRTLVEKGYLAYAVPELVELVERYTTQEPDGYMIRIPPELNPKGPADVHTCDRLVIFPAGAVELDKHS